MTYTINTNQIQLPNDAPIIVCFGGGVDSTAMLIALKRAGIRPDLITFADTGAEKPETYEHVRRMDPILVSWGFPTVTWCKKNTTDRVDYDDLEGNCVDNETLPSLAFGMKSCSIKWKQGPQDYVLKGCKAGPNRCEPHPIWTDAQERGVKPCKLIGYDAGAADLRRSKNLKTEDSSFQYRYPLQDLGMVRADCVALIVDELGPGMVPIKSACFFCPASKKWELYWLAGQHPELFERALRMEWVALTGKHSRFDEVEFGDSWENLVRNAERFPSTNTTVGLGRSMAWNQWARVNGIVDGQGRVIMDRETLLNTAARLQGDGLDNAQDFRACA
jgi:hypothetical protein